MPKDKISMRQLIALLFAALLSPAVTLLPGSAVVISGGSAWLAPLFALPAALAICWVTWAIFRTLPADAGLAEALQAAFGSVAGRAITVIYLIWCLFVLAISACLYAQRLLAGGYQGASLTLFLVALLAVVLWLGLGKVAAFARAGEIFFLILATALGVVVMLSLFNIKVAYVLPLWMEDVTGIAVSAVPVLKVMSYAIFAGFLGGHITRRATDARLSARWIAAFCGMLVLLLLAVLGQFGPKLTTTMDAPFFQMVAGVGVHGAFQRLEAVASALWVLSDLTLLGLLTLSCRAMIASAFSIKKVKWTAIPISILTFIGALILFQTPKIATAAIAVGQVGSLILSFGVLPFVLFALKMRKQA